MLRNCIKVCRIFLIIIAIKNGAPNQSNREGYINKKNKASVKAENNKQTKQKVK